MSKNAVIDFVCVYSRNEPRLQCWLRVPIKPSAHPYAMFGYMPLHHVRDEYRYAVFWWLNHSTKVITNRTDFLVFFVHILFKNESLSVCRQMDERKCCAEKVWMFTVMELIIGRYVVYRIIIYFIVNPFVKWRIS